MIAWSTGRCIATGIGLGLLAALGLSGCGYTDTVDYDYLRVTPKPAYSATVDQPAGYGRVAPVGPGMVGMTGE